MIGALRATNGWDYPTYLALSIATLGLVARARRRRGATMRAALAVLGCVVAGLLALSSALFLPFTQHFAAAAGLRLWLETGTSATELLKINGLWLFLLLSAGLLLYRRRPHVATQDFAASTATGLLVGALVLLVVAVVLNASALFILVPLAAAAAWLGIVVVRAAGMGRGRTRTNADKYLCPRSSAFVRVQYQGGAIAVAGFAAADPVGFGRAAGAAHQRDPGRAR